LNIHSLKQHLSYKLKQDKRERAASGEIEYYSQQKPTEVFNLKRLTVKDLVNKRLIH
jgi:hypothetical protein